MRVWRRISRSQLSFSLKFTNSRLDRVRPLLICSEIADDLFPGHSKPQFENVTAAPPFAGDEALSAEARRALRRTAAIPSARHCCVSKILVVGSSSQTAFDRRPTQIGLLASVAISARAESATTAMWVTVGSNFPLDLQNQVGNRNDSIDFIRELDRLPWAADKRSGS